MESLVDRSIGKFFPTLLSFNATRCLYWNTEYDANTYFSLAWESEGTVDPFPFAYILRNCQFFRVYRSTVFPHCPDPAMSEHWITPYRRGNKEEPEFYNSSTCFLGLRRERCRWWTRCDASGFCQGMDTRCIIFLARAVPSSGEDSKQTTRAASLTVSSEWFWSQRRPV